MNIEYNIFKIRNEASSSSFKIELSILNRLKLLVLEESIKTCSKYKLRDIVNNIIEFYLEAKLEKNSKFYNKVFIFKRSDVLTSTIKIELNISNRLKLDILNESIKTGENYYLQHYLNNIIEYYLDNFNPIPKKGKDTIRK